MKTIRPGQLIYWRANAYIVLEILGLKEVLLRPVSQGETVVALASECSSTPARDNTATHSHVLAKDRDWDLAVERLEAIRPLLDLPNRSANDVQRRADELGKAPATLYRWMQRFEEVGLVSSLMRKPRKDKGVLRIEKELEEIIDKVIEEEYLVKERPKISKIIKDIGSACWEADLTPPHKNTIYARIGSLDEERVLEKRVGKKAAKQRFKPILGSFPGGDVPYAVVQIDHTPMNICIVDSEHRLPIGKPYLTAAIDVATKAILGFRITLDPPSALSAGLCVAHAVSKKEYWLALRNIDAEWPFFGKPNKIHVDNAKEFQGSMLRRACEEHNIGLEFRPKGQPNYGPHIERFFRTYLSEAHSLPGTTFSNVSERMGYDSEGNACFTLEELELWFTYYVVYVYLNEPHSGIAKLPPINRYYQLVHGTSELPGIGLPEAIEDEEKFRLDFTPYYVRTITREGVRLDNIQYYSPILRKWIDKRDPDNPKEARKYIFARDPRDISKIYFLDPDTNQYHAIPYHDNRHPPITLWELRAVTERIKQDPYAEINEEAIFKGIKMMRELEREAIEKTRLAKQQRATEKKKRRQAERRRTGELEQIRHGIVSPTPSPPIPPPQEENNEPIKPFDDMEWL